MSDPLVSDRVLRLMGNPGTRFRLLGAYLVRVRRERGSNAPKPKPTSRPG